MIAMKVRFQGVFEHAEGGSVQAKMVQGMEMGGRNAKCEHSDILGCTDKC